MSRQIGKGMKPRRAQEQTSSADSEVQPVSADEVQQEAAEEPQEQPAESELTAPKQEPESVQNLDEPKVADEEAAELLEKLRQSSPSIAEIEAAVDRCDSVRIEPNGDVSISPVLGMQPNGDCKVALTVPEYFVQPCKDFAEADGGKSLDQWCSEFFLQALEAYCQPAKGR